MEIISFVVLTSKEPPFNAGSWLPSFLRSVERIDDVGLCSHRYRTVHSLPRSLAIFPHPVAYYPKKGERSPEVTSSHVHDHPMFVQECVEDFCHERRRSHTFHALTK